MDIEEIRKEYEIRSDKYRKLKEEVIYILETEISKKKIPYQQITGRVKTFDSFIDKVKRLEIKEPFEEIKDLSGVRVICLFLSDLKRIDEIIEKCFKIEERDDKIESEPDAFGYMSVHYVGSILDTFTGARYDEIKTIKFEIQLRTIAMHAWSTISHYIMYKSQLDIPSHLRKDFNALSAMFYVADKHFEMFYNEAEKAREVAMKQVATTKLEIEEINYNNIEAYLLWKYKDRKHNDESETISRLVEQLIKGGYTSIKQLDEVVKKSEKAFEAYENENMAKPGENKPCWDIAIVRISLYIADEIFLNIGSPAGHEKEKNKLRKYRHLVE